MILFQSRESPEDTANGGQFGTRQIDVGTLSETIGKVSCRRGHDGTTGCDPRLIAHAQTATGHFRTGTGHTKDAVIPLLDQLGFVHLGGRGDPETGRNGRLELVEQFARRTKVSDVRHARTDKDLVNGTARHITQQGTGIRIIRKGQYRFLEFVQVNVNDLRVLGFLVGFHEDGIGQPFFHTSNTAFQCTGIAIAFGNHPFQHDDIGIEVLDNGFLIQLNGTSGRTAFGRRITQFKGLFAFQMRQSLNLQDPTGENILFALFLDRE
mmetsp:Transcript_25601/g.59447  ORF Transcript_25601/g.59447 Transcript_25601/m.59447 type:complete len:266 (-) Transcript_25601:1169-1966(-)